MGLSFFALFISFSFFFPPQSHAPEGMWKEAVSSGWGGVCSGEEILMEPLMARELIVLACA